MLFVVVVVLLSDIIKNFRKKKSEKNEFGKRNLQRHSNVRRERWNIISFTLFIDSLCDIIKKTESIKGKDYEANFSLFLVHQTTTTTTTSITTTFFLFQTTTTNPSQEDMKEIKCHNDDEWKEIFRREEGAVKLAKRLGREKELDTVENMAYSDSVNEAEEKRRKLYSAEKQRRILGFNFGGKKDESKR